MPSDNFEAIKSQFNSQIKTNNENIDFFKRKIISLDSDKTLIDNAIKDLDKSVYDDILSVNQKMTDLNDAYKSRIDNGCWSDLYWNKYTVVVGGTPTTYVELKQIGISTLSSGSVLQPDGSGISSTRPGVEIKNLYGIKYYTEPYDKDVVNSEIISFTGRVSVGTTEVVIMSPEEANVVSGVSTGQLLKCEKNGVFAVIPKIVGIGTTSNDLSSFGFSSTSVSHKIIIDQSALVSVGSSDPDNLVKFSVLISPEQLSNISVPFGSNPYSPQTISIFESSSDLGKGVKVEFDNSGKTVKSESWNPFLSSLGGSYAKPNNVGAGKTYLFRGFNFTPQKKVSGNWVNMTKDEVGQIFVYNSNDYRSYTVSTCTSLETAVGIASSALAAAETSINSSTGSINKKLQVSTYLRENRNKINLQIWGHRSMMGQLSGESLKLENYKTSLDDPEIHNIIT